MTNIATTVIFITSIVFVVEKRSNKQVIPDLLCRHIFGKDIYLEFCLCVFLSNGMILKMLHINKIQHFSSLSHYVQTSQLPHGPWAT